MASNKLLKPLLLALIGMLCSALVSPSVAQERKRQGIHRTSPNVFSCGHRIISQTVLYGWPRAGWIPIRCWIRMAIPPCTI